LRPASHRHWRAQLLRDRAAATTKSLPKYAPEGPAAGMTIFVVI
jgi:hypothetical protein